MSEKQKTIFKTMMIQSILVSVVFMLSQAFSWVLYDALGLSTVSLLLECGIDLSSF